MSKQQAIRAAMSVTNDIADGKLSPDELDRRALDGCRALFGTVAGPADPLWPLHLEVCRGVLAHDGIPWNELVEWVAVHRQRAGIGVPTAEAEIPRPPVAGAPVEPEDVPDPVQSDPPEPEVKVNPYGPARRAVARGRGLPGDDGLRPM